METKFVILRTRDAGVHMGYVDQQDLAARWVKLRQARRLWRWSGANTLNEVANNGVDESYTRISDPVKLITVLDVCEIIEVTSDHAKENLMRSRWGD